MSEHNGILYVVPSPDGSIPSFDNPHNAHGLIVSIAVLLPLAVFFTVLRSFTRLMLTKQHGSDDVLMGVATALSIAMSGIIFDMLNFGLGKHLWDVPLLVFYPHFTLRNLIIAMIFCGASAIAKISILLMYLRIFPSKGLRLTVYAVTFFCAGYGLATLLTNMFSCSPIQGSWELEYAATAKCIDRPVFYLAQASLGIAADIATLLIPIPAISKLRMDFRKKLGVGLLLTMGAFVCIVSMIRLQSLVNLLRSPDLTRVTPNALMWCVIELNVSIIGGCIPAIKPFLKRYLPFLVSPSLISSHSRSRGGGVGGGGGYSHHNYNQEQHYQLESTRPVGGFEGKKNAFVTSIRGLTGRGEETETDSVEEMIDQHQHQNQQQHQLTQHRAWGS